MHVGVELLCSPQPTAPTCVVGSWRLIDCFALTSAVRGFWDALFETLFINQTALPRWWTPIRAKRRSVAPLQRDMAVCMREILARPWVVYVSPLLQVFKVIFANAIELSSIYFQQRTRIGKIFARWHLAIAITSYNYNFLSFQSKRDRNTTIVPKTANCPVIRFLGFVGHSLHFFSCL